MPDMCLIFKGKATRKIQTITRGSPKQSQILIRNSTKNFRLVKIYPMCQHTVRGYFKEDSVRTNKVTVS